MFWFAKKILEALGLDPGRIYERLSAASIHAAVREQGLGDLYHATERIAPDLSGQYTTAHDTAEFDRYWAVKIRAMHAFQVSATLEALDHVEGEALVIGDIGDSSGNHGAYIKALAPAGKIARVVSVNLDPVAVEKVRANGGEAILARAEEVEHHDLRPDLWVSFETLEHLTDPVRFLHGLAARGSAEYMLISIPLCIASRFGGSHLRMAPAIMPERLTPEQVHVYEFSLADWELLARFSGFKTVVRRIYRQYPRRHPLWFTYPLWRRLDFPGFATLLLRRDLSLAQRYTGW